MNTPIEKPYVGPRTFQENERDRFFGRDREARDLLALAISEPMVLFYAQSGAGKSSLVNTCLIPDLKSKGFRVFSGRVAGDVPAGIDVDNIYVFNLVRSLLPNEVNLGLLEKLSIREFFSDAVDHTLQADPAQDVRPHVLIIDQFEELFNTHHEAWEKRGEFFKQLAEAMETDPYLWAIFVMREDFIAALDPYAYMLPSRLRMRYYMQRLERDAALDAVKKPVKDLRPFAGGVAETLVDNLARINIKLPDGSLDSQPGQYVEPVQLQVVCYSLWENLKSNRPFITEDDLREVGDVNQSLEKFYDVRVSTVAKEKIVEERLIREWFDYELITIGGTRNMVLRNLKNDGGLDDKVIQALQGDLVRAEMRGGQTWYELSHDRLIEPVHVSNTKWFTANLSFFQQQAALWVAQDRSEGLLLRGKELEQAELEQSKREAESKTTPKDELDFLAASKKAREREKREKRGNLLVRILAVVATIAFFAAIGLAIWANQSKDQANKTANENATLAAQRQQSEEDARVAEGNAVALKAVADSKASLARAGELAAQAQVLGQSNSSRSLLLAITAFKLNLNAQSGDILPIVYQALRDSVGRSTGLILSGHSGQLTAVGFSPGPESRWLATGDSNGTTQLWNLAAPEAPPFLITSGGYDPIEKLLFSNDNRWLVVLGGSYYYSEGRIRLLDLSTPTNDLYSLDSVLPKDAFVTDATLSTESKLLAVTYNLGNGGGISLFSTENIKQPLQTLPIQWKVEKVAFSADGTHLVFADEKNNIFFWEIAQPADTIGYISSNMILITSLRFSSDGRWLAVTGEKSFDSNQYQGTPSAKIYSIQSRSVFREVFDEKNRSPDDVNFSPDGKWITAIYNGSCKYYETDCIAMAKVLLFPVDNPDAQPTVLYTEADAIITSVSINRNGRLVVGDATGSARIWDLDSIPSDPQIASAHAGPISILALSPDGRSVLSAGPDNIRLWKVESLSSSSILTRRSADPITNVVRSVDGTTLAVSGNDVNVPLRLLELNPDNFNNGDDIRFKGDEGSFTTFTLGPKTDWIAGVFKADSSDKFFMYLWKTSEPIKPVIVEINSDADAITFSPDEGLLAIANKTGKVKIYKIADLISISGSGSSTSLPQIELLDSVVGIVDLRFSPNGDQLIAANDERILIWNIGKPDEPPNTLRARAPIAVSTDHKILATSSPDNTVLLWDFSNFRAPVRFLPGSSEAITVLTFSQDDHQLAVGSKDRIVRVFDLETDGSQANAYTLEGHTNTITSLAFSPQGEWLASGSSDFTVRLWNVKNLNASPVILRGHDAEINYVGFTNDDKWVVSASADKTVRLWSINPDTLVQAACNAAERNFTPAEWIRFFPDLKYIQENMPCNKYPIEEYQPTQIAIVATPTPYPTAGVQPTSTPTSPPLEVEIIYNVKSGDTLSYIAIINNTTLEKLMVDNNIINPDTIQVGQPIRIIATITPIP